jgi:hypothetical protein
MYLCEWEVRKVVNFLLCEMINYKSLERVPVVGQLLVHVRMQLR